MNISLFQSIQQHAKPRDQHSVASISAYHMFFGTPTACKKLVIIYKLTINVS